MALGLEPVPIFGQFFVEVEDADPVELLDGVVVVDPDVELLLRCGAGSCRISNQSATGNQATR